MPTGWQRSTTPTPSTTRLPRPRSRGAQRYVTCFRREFAAAEMTCIPEVIHESGRRRDPGMARPGGTARLRLLHGVRRAHRPPARLLGQTLVPATPRTFSSGVGTARRVLLRATSNTRGYRPRECRSCLDAAALGCGGCEVRRGPPWPLWSQRAPRRRGPRHRRPSPDPKVGRAQCPRGQICMTSEIPDGRDIPNHRKSEIAGCFECDPRPCSPVRGSEIVAVGPIPPRRSV